MRTITLPSALLLALAGCAAVPPQSYQPLNQIPQQDTVEHEFDKNYTIGESRTVAIGQPIIKVRDYKVTTRHMGKSVIPSENFEIWVTDPTASRPLVSGSKGVAIPVEADVVIEGEPHVSFHSAPQSQFYGIVFLKSPSGDLNKTRYRFVNNFIANAKPSDMAMGIKVVPPHTTFEIKENVSRSTQEAGYVNYEIVFTGSAGDQINFVYREYTSSDMARQPFFQNLTYSKSDPFIRFRDLRIRIDQVSNEGITYTVVED